MRTPRPWLAVVLSIVTTSTSFAAVLHVPGEYQRIQVAVLAAAQGDTVLVADGLYAGVGNRDIDFLGKSIVLLSENGPRFTMIYCGGDQYSSHRGFNFHSGESADAKVQGFTITGGWAEHGGGLYIHQSSPTITGNWIVGNTASGVSYGYGGGIYSYESSSIYTGNVFAGNSASGNGGGIYFWNSTPVLESNTFTRNETGFSGGGFYCIYNPSTTVIHSIFWDNTAGDGESFYVDTGASITVSYSDVEGGWPGEGNFIADPEFVLPDRSDFRLLWESPCIDTGNPGVFDPDGTRKDIGAFFFDQDDYLTLYLTPDTRVVQKGGQLGVTYTLINRRPQPTPSWILSIVKLPNSSILPIIGPQQYNVPGSVTLQVPLHHPVPQAAPVTGYGYTTLIGVPPSTLYDDDGFRFEVVN